MNRITIKKIFPTQYLLSCEKCGREGYVHKKFYDKFGWKHECPIEVKASESYLDSIGVTYDYVCNLGKMIIVFKDGSYIDYESFLHKHNKEVELQATEVINGDIPHQQQPQHQVDTEKIIKSKSPKKKNK